MANGVPGSGILDYLVFSKVREATGGRMRFCLTAAAPIAKDTQEFISMTICPMIGGYGLTETSAYVLIHIPTRQLNGINRMGALCDPLAWTSDAVGDIPACIEVKLVGRCSLGSYFSSRGFGSCKMSSNLPYPNRSKTLSYQNTSSNIATFLVIQKL